jgi:probable rRNA maturation factor
MTAAIDILVQSTRWRAQPRAQTAVRNAIAAAAAVLKKKRYELSVVLTHDRAIQKLNREWRGFDKPTNVLSFPAHTAATKEPFLGDIVIAYETLAREAKGESKPFLHHLSHLTVHGFLHLMGYDHEENQAAETMENLERRVLATMKIPDPYGSPARP